MIPALWLAAAGAALSVVASPRHAIDHVGIGCADLDAGIAFVAETTGVAAAKGGVHPGRGTQNALMSLGEGSYLEIIAPVPGEKPSPENAELVRLSRPRPVFFALRSPDLEKTVRLLNENGFATEPIRPGSRKKPDGSMLAWRTVNVAGPGLEGAPFFIEWAAGTAHPSTTSPAGCRLVRLDMFDPEPRAVSNLLAEAGADVRTAAGERGLRLTLACPKGTVALGP